jgi:hypothetical protein
VDLQDWSKGLVVKAVSRHATFDEAQQRADELNAELHGGGETDRGQSRQ